MALVPVVLIAGLVAGCGSDDSSGSSGSSSNDYCDTAKNIKDDFSGMDFSKLDDKTFNQLQDNLNKLEASAPKDVQDSWEVLTAKFAELDGILDDAGISFDDLSTLQAGQMPEGMDLTKAKDLVTKMNEFTTGAQEEVNAATKKISENLKDECGIDTEGDGS
jgi:hypothetical protein